MHGVTVHGSIDMRCEIIVRTYNKNRACTTSALLRLSLSHHLACCLLGTLRVCAREERDRTTVNAFFLRTVQGHGADVAEVHSSTHI